MTLMEDGIYIYMPVMIKGFSLVKGQSDLMSIALAVEIFAAVKAHR